MTDIKFKRKSGEIVYFSMDGHAGYACEGEDIVCAALSVLSQTMIIGIEEILKIKLKYEIDDGLLICSIEKNSSEEILSCQVLLQTMLKSIESMIVSYGKYINLEIEEV
ncbi:ribosomal-processing cysteine protease Prp [Clostridium polynesiense]|uniref:ribosomal-processing cysteine protease Prp n=1 Tax=Clostridium polynesiense TaxID=1325933 RepID=UPI00058AE48D|nr:ribosomal-processing cysteine protease Prp [Clostridium polynesiense]